MKVFLQSLVPKTSSQWTALSTVVMTVFTCLLWYVSREANKANIATQRAFVYFVGVQGGPKIVDATGKHIAGVQMAMPWENSGTTPTRNATSHVNYQLWPGNLPDDFEYPDLPSPARDRPVVIGPKAVVVLPINVPIGDFDALRQGKTRLFTWGWVTYDDVFEGTPPRLSEFCSEITNVNSSVPDITDASANITWQSENCEKHNCSDADCVDYASRTARKHKQ